MVRHNLWQSDHFPGGGSCDAKLPPPPPSFFLWGGGGGVVLPTLKLLSILYGLELGLWL